MELDLEAEIAQWPVGSASVAVVDDTGIVAIHDDGARHEWASVTKVATALTIIDACAEGVISLDDQVRRPDGATVAHLLAHASGVAMDSDDTVTKREYRRIYSNRGIEIAARHLALATRRSFAEELHDRVLDLLDMTGTELAGSPAHGMRGPIRDLATLAHELLSPRLLLPQVVERMTSLQYPGLPGVLPGFGRQSRNDWGLGVEIRGNKAPHWTAPENSPDTFGHFGQSGSFLWVDPRAGVACVSLSDTPFGEWATTVWPALSSKVLEAHGHL